MRFLSMVLLLLSGVLSAYSHTNYTGYSGAPGTSNTCAGSCHGSGTGTITVTGFPTSYTPGQAYIVTVSRTGTVAIANFNASARRGTTSTNAGVIAAGTATSTYNVSAETNGVHFTSGQQSSGTFSWTAPATGTGDVRLYLSGHQGTGSSGPNNAFALLATEALPPPAQATNPSPANNATDVATTPTLTWTAGSGTVSHDVYFGSSNPPVFIGNQPAASYLPDALAEGTVYFWRIDERNAGGVTAGSLWQFTTLTAAPPSAPQELVALPDPPYLRLYWSPSPAATGYKVYRATSFDVPLLPANLVGAAADTFLVDSSALGLSDTRNFYIVTSTNP